MTEAQITALCLLMLAIPTLLGMYYTPEAMMN